MIIMAVATIMATTVAKAQAEQKDFDDKYVDGYRCGSMEEGHREIWHQVSAGERTEEVQRDGHRQGLRREVDSVDGGRGA